MEFEKIKKNLMEGGLDVALGTGAAIVSLHVARRMPKYSGWVLTAAGLIGIMVGGKVLKAASVVTASIGAISAMNAIAQENGVPAISGFKGTINKIIPQLNAGATPMLGFGSVEDMNERLLGTPEEEMHGTDELMMGLDEDLRGQDDLTGFGSLM
jgi:phosphohistidine swiveling domain-containing protein